MKHQTHVLSFNQRLIEFPCKVFILLHKIFFSLWLLIYGSIDRPTSQFIVTSWLSHSSIYVLPSGVVSSTVYLLNPYLGLPLVCPPWKSHSEIHWEDMKRSDKEVICLPYLPSALQRLLLRKTEWLLSTLVRFVVFCYSSWVWGILGLLFFISELWWRHE